MFYGIMWSDARGTHPVPTPARPGRGGAGAGPRGGRGAHLGAGRGGAGARAARGCGAGGAQSRGAGWAAGGAPHARCTGAARPQTKAAHFWRGGGPYRRPRGWRPWPERAGGAGPRAWRPGVGQGVRVPRVASHRLGLGLEARGRGWEERRLCVARSLSRLH